MKLYCCILLDTSLSDLKSLVFPGHLERFIVFFKFKVEILSIKVAIASRHTNILYLVSLHTYFVPQKLSLKSRIFKRSPDSTARWRS